MRGHAVMGEQGVQEVAEHAPLWGPSVEDQRGEGSPQFNAEFVCL